MLRYLLISLFLLLPPAPAEAAVEVGLQGQEPATVAEVYMREGVPFLALDDLLGPLGLRGAWDSVEHLYRIETPRGTAVISPGSHYLRLGSRQIALEHQPRFIDGRLRVSEEFLLVNLAPLLTAPLHYRNLNPAEAVAEAAAESPLDRLFAFLLRKKTGASGGGLRGVAIDPGHGGQDPGAIGAGGVKEKTVALETAQRLEKLLKMRLGIPVFMSRDGDYAVNLDQRHATAAQPEVDAFVLLHAQAAFGDAARGITLFVRPLEQTAVAGETPLDDGGSLALARQLAEALQGAGLTVSGIFRAPLLPLGRGNLPTVLVELGYLSNGDDRSLLSGADGQTRLAEALFEGLRAFATAPKENPL